MLPKSKRLTGKDIQYMLRRGAKRRGKYFGIMTIPQYARLSYHQRSIQIPVKLDKRASMRNELKRIAHEVWIQQGVADDTSGPYKKRFIFINKKGIDQWGKSLTSLPKSDRKDLRKTYCEEDFNCFKQSGTGKHLPRQGRRTGPEFGTPFQKKRPKNK